MAIGEAIRQARLRKRWTQPMLASRIGTHNRNIGHWETGHEGRLPDWSALWRMLDVFEDTAFTLAVARFATAGRVGAVAGAICGVRTMAAMAMAVEIDELRDDLARVRSDLLQPTTSESIESVYCNILDVLMTCNQMLVELSRDYGLSLPEMQRRHLQEVKRKGYVLKKKHHLVRGQVA